MFQSNALITIAVDLRAYNGEVLNHLCRNDFNSWCAVLREFMLLLGCRQVLSQHAIDNVTRYLAMFGVRIDCALRHLAVHSCDVGQVIENLFIAPIVSDCQAVFVLRVDALAQVKVLLLA